MDRRKFVKYVGTASMVLGAASCASIKTPNSEHDEDICREAWMKLRKSESPPFDYVNPRRKLPKVLIYGDSISIGYTSIVRKELEGKADVFRIHKNGLASLKLIPTMEAMREAMFQPHLEKGWNFDWDVIHFNVGLHDLKYMKGAELDTEKGTVISTLDQYRTRFRGACEYLTASYPKAQLIFATTTAVPVGAPGRIVGDSVKYNKVALEVLADFPAIVINDLYGFTMTRAAEWYLKPGNVHYNQAGKEAQGKHVSRVIEQYL